MQEEQVIAATRRWVERFVVGLNLCPFARRELEQGTVRFCVTDATDEARLLLALRDELDRLQAEQSIETTLLIHPGVLRDFHDYNQFLDSGEELLRALDLEGVFQIASFHPQYQFAGTTPGDAENYSNRSPYPMLHILREAGVARAVAAHPCVEEIPQRNIAELEGHGVARLMDWWQECFDE